MGTVDRDAAGPRSLSRLLALFDSLSRAPDGLTLAELNVDLHSPKSSLLNLLRPLVAEAFLIHSGGTYRLGPSIFRLASSVLDAWDLPRLVRPFMEELGQATGESVLLSVMDPAHGTLTYVEIVDSPHPVRYQIAVGTVRPLYASASGRVLLAHAEPAWLKAYLEQVSFDAETAVPVTRSSLRDQLQAARRDGVITSIDQHTVGLSAIAAPVFDATGRCVAAVNIAGPSDRFRDNIDTLRQQVADMAARASQALAEAAAAAAAPA